MWSTIVTRPMIEVEALFTSTPSSRLLASVSGVSRCAAVASTRLAWARAWACTSALTRALNLSASGTLSETMASSST